MIIISVLFGTGISVTVCAQFSVNAQLRTRSEFRNGQGAPLPATADPAFFTSQRTRLGVKYTTSRIQLGLTVQDVRVWGQDASTINKMVTAENNGLLLHEGWAEIALLDSGYKKNALQLKIGRQELVYDDQRLLGNLDWLQQARRHDAAVLKFSGTGWQIHAGGAYNQNKEAASGTVYNQVPPGNYPGNTNGGSIYKSFVYLYGNRSFENTTLSFLLFNDQFNKFSLLTENGSSRKVWEKGNWNRYTTGLSASHKSELLQLNASLYYQGGQTASGQQLSAGMFTVQCLFTLARGFTSGIGADITSGGITATNSSAFDPLYGTPHKFWGYMDYFYAGSAFGEKGLANYFLKNKYLFSEKWQVTADLHQFYTTSHIRNTTGEKMSRRLGTEIDVVLQYALNKQVSFESGWGMFLSTATLVSPSVKNIPDAQQRNTWAYLMVNIQPGFMFKN